jgi:LPS export ABC transporter permease LptG
VVTPRAVPVVDRYLLRELALPFAFACVLFTFFLLIGRIYDLTDLVIAKGVPLHLVLQLVLFMFPSFLALTLPMALLVAVLVAGGRLAGDLEIVAFKAAGVSLGRLFRPVVAAGLLVAGASAAMTLVVSPLANQEFNRQLFRILQTRAVTGLHERVFNASFGDVVIYVEDVSASQVALGGVLVSDERDPRLSRIITAREGRVLSDEGNRRITLRLLNGAVHEADVVPAAPPGAPPTAPPGGAAGAARYRFTSFSVYDMSLSLDSALKGPLRGEKPERDLPFDELRARADDPALDPRTRAAFLAEWHKRLATPVAALVFALVGFPLAVRSHRGGRAIALIASLAIFLAYYLLLSSLESTAVKTGMLPPGIAVWAPNALFGLVGTILFLATSREWRPPRLSLLWTLVELARRARPPWRARDAEARAPVVRESTHILDRYLVREYVMLLGVGLAVAAALFVVIDLMQDLDRYLRVKPPIVYILQHLAYRLPAALHDTLPIVMLVATIFLFLTLSRNHELTAMKAAGLSLYRISLPVLLLGLAVTASAGVFQELVLPHLNELGEEVEQVKIRGQLPRHLRSRERLWMRTGDTRFYRIELLHPGTNDMWGVTVLELDREFRLLQRLDARRAHWTEAGWELTEGAFREIRPDGQVRTVPFAYTALDLKEEIDDFTRAQKTVRRMSFLELRDYVARLEATGFQVQKYLVELYAKLSFPLINLVMVLVAIPFALQSPRSGRLAGIGLAIAIMAAYLVVHFTCLALARADLLPPLLAAWTANVIFLGLGVSLLLRART